MDDLRIWLEKVDKKGELKVLEGAHWDLEIGYMSAENAKRLPNPALLFDRIAGYPPGYRVLTCSMATRSRFAFTANLADTASNLEMVGVLSKKLSEWEAEAGKFPPEAVSTGPVLENIDAGKDVDLFKFPVPKWHELDGGRYIGTGHVFITKDPETGQVNLGTYRVAAHDKNSAGVYIATAGKLGKIHMDKWHAMGKPCPVAVSVGHHPLMLAMGVNLFSKCEYEIAGAIMQERIKVITEELTGLPIPADGEIALAGWIYPGKTREEGPFGEATGYYAGDKKQEPLIEVERVYYRNNPIILGSPPGRPPAEHLYAQQMVWCARVHEALISSGIPGIKSVWCHEAAGGAKFIVVSIKQLYMGHAKKVALSAAQISPSFWGRYIIVVDDDIDPSNMNDVIWAMTMRSQPEKDIDIIRDCSSIALDPLVPKPNEFCSTSMALINACVPFERMKKDFPPTIQYSHDLVERGHKKFKDLF